MQKSDAAPHVVHADHKQLHLEIVVPLSLDERTELQREWQAVLRLYEKLRAERIRRSH